MPSSTISQLTIFQGCYDTAVQTVAARARLQSADQGDVIVPGSRTTRFVYKRRLINVHIGMTE